MSVNTYDPFGRDSDAPLAKFDHMFEEGDRVRVKETGRPGKLQAINGHGGHVVRLDSGHTILARDFELEPEDWQATATGSAKVEKAAGSVNPFGNDDEPSEPAKTYSAAARELLEPFVALSAGLMKAVAAGTASVADRLQILKCIENIRTGNIETHPFDDYFEDENFRNLRVLAEKYAGTGATGNILAKRARSGLRVGMRVRDRFTGNIGKITSIEGHLVKVEYPDGESYSLMGSTAETLEPIEAAA